MTLANRLRTLGDFFLLSSSVESLLERRFLPGGELNEFRAEMASRSSPISDGAGSPKSGVLVLYASDGEDLAGEGVLGPSSCRPTDWRLSLPASNMTFISRLPSGTSWLSAGPTRLLSALK